MPLKPEQAQLIVGATSALFALALVIVTTLYYFETQKHTAEMERSRRPAVKVNLVVYNDIHARLTIENIGRGTARNIKATWGFTDVDLEQTFHSLQLDPDDRQMINELPFSGNVSTFAGVQSELEDREGKLETTIKFEDEFGKNYCECEIIGIKETVESRMDLEQQE